MTNMNTMSQSSAAVSRNSVSPYPDEPSPSESAQSPSPTVGRKTFRSDEPDVPLLIKRCKSGNIDSWNILVHRYQKDIYQVAFSFSHNREDAEDVTAQVFLRLYQSLNTFRSESRFRPWLFTIVHRTFLDMCVRPVSRSRRPMEYLRSTDDGLSWVSGILDAAPSSENVYLELEADQILSQAIAALPVMHRMMLGRFYSEGQSYPEIAAAIGVPIGTVKSRLNRAHKLLRGKLMRYQER
jgi:RNA polymerase sigma-70 factor (ECF subfamily)